MEPSLRFACLSDLPSLAGIEQAFSRGARWTPEEYVRKGCEAVVIGEPVRAALWWKIHRGGRLEVVSVAVSPKHRRKGYARKLLAFALEFAAATRLRRVFLDVNAANEGAIMLYREIGFRVVTRTPGDVLRMVRDV